MPVGDPLTQGDPFSPALALAAPQPLDRFNGRGVLDPADVHVARTLAQLGGVDLTTDGGRAVLLAAALAVRAPRLGHVFVDLATVAETAVVDTGGDGDAPGPLPWPEPAPWVDAVRAASTLTAAGDTDEAGELRPLRLVGTRLYLDRYWREERALASALRAHDATPLRTTELAAVAASVGRLFPSQNDAGQRIAVCCGLLRGLTVIAGGPGTGKTTTVARLCALLALHGDVGGRRPLIGLCAPTGRAAARLQEAIHEQARSLPDLPPDAVAVMLELRASTIHRLLGSLGPGRFRHHARNPLPHDVVVVDETSMVSLTMMGRLVEAVRRDAQIVIVGDPDQLSAIEAGAVLRDIVGPAADAPRFGAGMRAVLERTAGVTIDGADGDGDGAYPFGDGIAVLRRGHRFGAAIGELADAIRGGDGDAALAALEATDVVWLQTDTGEPAAAEAALAPLREEVLTHYGRVIAAARDGDAGRALAALGGFRLLCAHRRGAHGVSGWTVRIEEWLGDQVDGFEPSASAQPGRPLLITANDYELRLFNGDTGVLVAGGDGELGAAFERDGTLVTFAPSRLANVEPLYASTVHKSQGSQFDTTAVILPDADSRVLSRELLYTAVTRARRRLLLVGSEEALRAAIDRPVARASGLRERLWTPGSHA